MFKCSAVQILTTPSSQGSARLSPDDFQDSNCSKPKEQNCRRDNTVFQAHPAPSTAVEYSRTHFTEESHVCSLISQGLTHQTALLHTRESKQ